MRKKENISIAISILALFTAILAVVRCEPIIVDWLGILVGILALLVTVLIGWQIYNVVYLDHKIKKLVREDMRNVQTDMRIGIREVAIETNNRMAISYLRVQNWHMLIITFDVLIRDIINNKDKKRAIEIIDMIISIADFKHLMSERDIKELKGLEERAKGLRKLTDKVFELITFLHNL